jgi:hypothetical protein
MVVMVVVGWSWGESAIGIQPQYAEALYARPRVGQGGDWFEPTIATRLTSRETYLSSVEFGATYEREQTGRTLFMTLATLKAGLVFPQLFSSALSQADSRVVAGLSLLAAGTTLYASYIFTEDVSLGYGRVAMMSYGGTMGLVYPQLIASLLHYGTDLDRSYQRIGNQESTAPAGDLPSQKVQAWASLLAYPYGMYVGWQAPLANGNAFGDAAVRIYMSQTLGLMGYALPLYFLDPQQEKERNRYFTASAGLSLALLPLGSYFGGLMTQQNSYSSGRGVLLYVTGAMGTASGLIVPALFGIDDHFDYKRTRQIYLTSALTGYALGSAYGLSMHPERRYGFWQSIFMGASAAGGAAMGLSIPYLSRSDNNNSYLAAGLVGGWIGLGLGETLSQGINERLQSAHGALPERVSVSLPGLWQLPALLAEDKQLVDGPLMKVNLSF